VSSLQSLAGGFLSGKHQTGRGPHAGTRFTLGTAAGRYQERYWHEREFATVEALRTGGGCRHVHGPDGGAWVLAHPAVTSANCRREPADQLDDVLGRGGQGTRRRSQEVLHELTLEYRFGSDDPDDRDPDPLATSAARRTRRGARGASR